MVLKLKLKGAYEYPDPLNYYKSISEMQPPGWHKDWGNIISTRAAVTAMVYGVDPETFIRSHSDPFDFMCRVRVGRSDTLLLGGYPVQKTFRYYVARNGGSLVKVSPPAGPEGMFKRKNGVTEAEYMRVMQAGNWQWDASVCTGNKSKYDKRETGIQSGWKVADCCKASSFDFQNVNYDFYVQEAKKLII